MKTASPSELSLLCCPACGGDLVRSVPEALSCEGCRASYPLVDSIPCFSDPNTYWGEEFSLDEMRAINDLARSRCWRTAVEELVAPKSPSRARYISDFSRADWRFLFPMQSGWKVLDVGAGWGSLSAILATLCGQVAALESSLERARFIQARIEQDRLDNLVAVHGDLSHPPLRPNTFDLVALNGVLEWLGWADTSRNTRTVQIELLRNARRLLKPEGWLYIGIENRFGISYWLGAMDHSYLKYTSLMPRPLAHAVTRLAKGHTYRTYTYSPIGYRRLLEQAGYRDIQFYGVMPSYSRPINYWPLAEGAPLQRFAQVLFSDKPNNLSLKSRIAQWAVERSPASLVAWAAQWMAPHLLISARKGESRAGMD